MSAIRPFSENDWALLHPVQREYISRVWRYEIEVTHRHLALSKMYLALENDDASSLDLIELLRKIQTAYAQAFVPWGSKLRFITDHSKAESLIRDSGWYIILLYHDAAVHERYVPVAECFDFLRHIAPIYTIPIIDATRLLSPRIDSYSAFCGAKLTSENVTLALKYYEEGPSIGAAQRLMMMVSAAAIQTIQVGDEANEPATEPVPEFEVHRGKWKRVEKAVQELGKEASADGIRSQAGINKADCLKILREMERQGQYNGFATAPRSIIPDAGSVP